MLSILDFRRQLLYIEPAIINIPNFQIFQAAQLLVCDWLLETRTSLWENDFEDHNLDVNYVAEPAVLLGFQEDLSSLKKLVQHLPVSLTIMTRLVNLMFLIVLRS